MAIRITVQNAPELIPPLLQFRQMFLVERPRLGAPSHEEITRLLHEGQVVAALSSYGYLLCHPGQWLNESVLFLDELFLHPQVRKQGYLKELVEWLQAYCLFNGLSTILLNTFGMEEARPMQSHLGASSVSMLMKIAVPSDQPLYRSTYRPPIMERPAPPRPRKKKKTAAVVAQVSTPPLEQPAAHFPLTPAPSTEEHKAIEENGILVPSTAVVRDGIVFPIDPERM